MLVHFDGVPTSISDFAIGVNTIEDKEWDLLDFLDYGPTEEYSPHGLDAQFDLTWLPGHSEEPNVDVEESFRAMTGNENQRDEEKLTTGSFKVEDEHQPCEQPITTRKRKRTATDCRVEWRAAISSAKAAIIENVKKITNEEILLREKYGELKGVVRVREMSKDYKNRDPLKDIFKKGKEELTNAKRELTEVILKEKLQQASKVRKSDKTKKDHEAFEIAEIRKQTLAEDIRVSVENAYCSKLYLTKLEAYKNCQVRYLTSLQTQICILADGFSRICHNKETLYEISGYLRHLRQVQGEIGEEITLREAFKKKKSQKVKKF